MPTLESTYLANEGFRATVTASVNEGKAGWLEPALLKTSVFDYGLTSRPLEFLPKTAKPVGDTPIEHDLLTYLAARVHAASGRLDYLEIGVSVLKSFDTQVHFHRNASFTAFDIEDPNWTRARLWGASAIEDTRPSLGIRKTKGRTEDRIYSWRFETDASGAPTNRIMYVEADALASAPRNGWAALAALRASKRLRPFNFVLSDGLHMPNALSKEMSALLFHRLLAGGGRAGLLSKYIPPGGRARARVKGGGAAAEGAPEKVLVAWDDCDENSKTHKAMKATVEGSLLRKFSRARLGPQVCYTHVTLNGWIGTGERPHGCCLMSTYDLREFFREEDAAPAASTSPAAKFARALFAQARANMRCSEASTLVAKAGGKERKKAAHPQAPDRFFALLGKPFEAVMKLFG